MKTKWFLSFLLESVVSGDNVWSPAAILPRMKPVLGTSNAEHWKDLGPRWRCWAARSTNPETLTCGPSVLCDRKFPYCLSQFQPGFLFLVAKSILTDTERKYGQFPNISVFWVYLVCSVVSSWDKTDPYSKVCKHIPMRTIN